MEFDFKNASIRRPSIERLEKIFPEIKMNKLLEIGTKLVSQTGDWEERDCDEPYDVSGPSIDEVVTIRKIGASYRTYSDGLSCYEPIIWLEEYPGDNFEDSYYLDNFELYQSIEGTE